ncbi:MAG: substrate-binding domain-containing protein [Gemmatimonadetes bacterium]|jgi:L-arabinose transport system substrate-binding protein|nr:substrate-binding domain-containing protein [Gemmatimonadota bacterium]MBT7862476.1 substrate-binding domain-containing protein [Gemmatimonadota bacterium]
MKIRRIGLAAVILALIVSAGCGPSQPDDTAPAEEEIRLGFLVKMPEELWFQNEWRFAQQCADKYGFGLIKIGTPDGEKLLSAIDVLAAKGAQGFVVCTPDVRLGTAVMAKARGHGMKVFTVDDQFVGADGQFMTVPHMGISAREIGRQVGRELHKEFVNRGWSMEGTGALGVTFDELETAKDRTDGTIEALVGAGFARERIYLGAEKTTDIPGGFDTANIVLTQHPEVERWLVFSMNDEGVLGSVRALEGRGFSAANTIGIGIGAGTGLTEFEKDEPTGYFATCMISPLRHGYETTELLYKWVKDGVAPPADTRTAGVMAYRHDYREVQKRLGLE